MRQRLNILIHIRPKNPWILLDIDEIWKSRELFYILVWRDIKIRYKQTVLGIAWVLFQPVVNMVLFSFFFGKVANMPSGNLPYPLFVLCGLIYWTFFSNALTNASNSLVANEDIIKKVYFPKIIAPLAAVGPCLLDFGINVIFLFLVIGWFGRIPSLLTLIVIPLALLITIVTVAGLGLLLSAVNVKFRDVRYILPFFIQVLLFVTPVIYPTSILKPSHLRIVALNPLTGVIDVARTVISGSSTFNWPVLTISFCSSIAVFFIGLIYFNKTERFFADIL